MEFNVRDLFTGADSVLKIEDPDLPAGFSEPDKSGEIFRAPGLIDLQVNGYAGIDFNAENLSIEQIEKASAELLKQGVTGFLPTLITGDPIVLERNLGLFREVMKGGGLASGLILGIHLEGPFISAAEGAKGAHPVNWIRPPDITLVEKWQELSGGNIRLLTMSPVHENSDSFIRACLELDIRVAIGHTDASTEQIQDAIKAGASLSTHLGNGMSKTIHRHQNLLFEQLASDELYASVIADGFHLSKSLFRIMDRTKAKRLFLVSDSTQFAGMEPGIYDTFIGGEVELDENRRLFMRGNPEFLAGTASSLLDCINFLVQEELVEAKRAWEMASLIPARYLYAGKTPESPDDFILFAKGEEGFRILLSCKNGKYYPT
jgi:N-acetylglucosamine-6-phosphate deacetylase